MECVACGSTQHAVQVFAVSDLPQPVRQWVEGAWVCVVCVQQIGERRRGFGPRARVRWCAAGGYACPRSGKGNAQLFALPECGADTRAELRVPTYAPPHFAVCNGCRQWVHAEVRRQRSSASSPSVVAQTQHRSTEMAPTSPSSSSSSSSSGAVQRAFFDSLPSEPKTLRQDVARVCLRVWTEKEFLNVWKGKRDERRKMQRALEDVPSPRVSRVKGLVEAFWEAASVPAESRKSRMVGKVRKQVRWVHESFAELWGQYMSEREKESEEVSYSHFCRVRPKHVQPGPDTVRCRCRWHMQCYMKLLAFNALCAKCTPPIPPIPSLSRLFEVLTCSPPTYECAFGTCTDCGPKKCLPKIPPLGRAQVSYREFAYETKGKVKILAPRVVSTSAKSFLASFRDECETFTAHHYAHLVSAKARMDLHSGLRYSDVVVHLDYTAKYVHEVHEQLQEDNYQKVKSSVLVCLVGYRQSGGLRSRTIYFQ
eukprot:TRINITY_DN1120_c0_g1_i7.p1 TRINITY_DN1120_c0_g1~~TRINITY_DN1120_c0_g1_i7.p1  ORF type:complete len:481 (-),score=-0.60 TRINITY_DN1120_c0_g1_i7:377-1819(-)